MCVCTDEVCVFISISVSIMLLFQSVVEHGSAWVTRCRHRLCAGIVCVMLTWDVCRWFGVRPGKWDVRIPTATQ